MSNVGDALSTGSTDGTGISDSTFSDASLGDQMMGGDGSFGTGDASAFGAGSGPSEFSQASDLATALSPGGAGGSSIGAQAASMTPPATAAATGGDPTGAASGTQSNTTPGSTPDQNQQQQTGGKQNQQNPDYAPPQAVSQLKALLKQLNSGKPAGPTGPTPTGGQAAPFALPTLAAGQTGAQSQLRQLVGAQPAGASLEVGQTGPQSPGPGAGFAGSQPGGARDVPGDVPGDDELKFDPATGTYSLPPGGVSTDADGNPLTAAGTRADQTPLPPSRPGAQPTQTADAGGGHDITVRKTGVNDIGGEPKDPTANLPTVVPPGSAAHPLPTHKPGASPAPAGPATSSILKDISGVSTGSPTALADLAQAAKVIAPLLPMIAGMFGGGGRRRGFGRFTGGRFMHGFGHLHGGQHPAGRGAWPYHHPQFGWHMHGRPPGQGWLPLHPNDAQALVGGQGGQPGQDPNAPDPNRPPKEGGSGGGSYTDPVGGPWSGNSVYNTLVGAESGGRNDGAPGQPAGGDGGIARGYFNIQTPTWGDFAQKVPGASRYQSADQAPYEIQRAVANTIPVARFGDRTRRILHSKFGDFNERMTVGELAEQKGGNLSRAAQLPPPQIPVTSQPMVAGGP